MPHVCGMPHTASAKERASTRQHNPDRHSHIGCTLSQSKTRVSHGYHTCTLSYSDDLGSEPVQCLLAYVSRNSMTGKAGLADCIHVVCCGVSVPIMMTPIP